MFASLSLWGKFGGIYACGATFSYIVPLPNSGAKSFSFKRKVEKEGLPRDSTPALGAGGLEFKSRRPDQSFLRLASISEKPLPECRENYGDLLHRPRTRDGARAPDGVHVRHGTVGGVGSSRSTPPTVRPNGIAANRPRVKSMRRRGRFWTRDHDAETFMSLIKKPVAVSEQLAAK